MAQITDKISKVTDGSARPITTAVDAGRSVGTKTLICEDLTGWDESTISFFVTYEKDPSGKVVKGTQTDFVGVRSGNTLNSIQVTGGSDRGNKIGDIVQQLPTSEYAKRQAEAFLKSHGQDGSLLADTVGTAQIKSKSVTSDKVDWATLPAFVGYSTVSQTAVTGVWSVVKMNTVDYDNFSAYDKSTGIYTIPKTGLYSISGAVTLTINQGEDFIIGSKLNGADDRIGFRNARATTGAGDTTGGVSVTPVKYNEGDKVNLGVFQNTGGNKNIPGGKAMTWCSIECSRTI